MLLGYYFSKFRRKNGESTKIVSRHACETKECAFPVLLSYTDDKLGNKGAKGHVPFRTTNVFLQMHKYVEHA